MTSHNLWCPCDSQYDIHVGQRVKWATDKILFERRLICCLKSTNSASVRAVKSTTMWRTAVVITNLRKRKRSRSRCLLHVHHCGETLARTDVERKNHVSHEMKSVEFSLDNKIRLFQSKCIGIGIIRIFPRPNIRILYFRTNPCPNPQ